ncbi:MAG TPA: 4-hydroxy-3-methylbut-2-enyl diphosphate reductase [Thermoanaerobaculaceae bacterium]|nr:4-hydroxy-3-methylbut-2-enyl diphosphate reductase [Thermoanaerobaculaceae bacterium]HRS14790.1 4-hydroxy-3-methylbut-2-enyl diphosphate reductase [Thermoanaerobaculaceae bacterium]
MGFVIRRAARYGFCSGVRAADIKVRRFAASGRRGAILGQVVHNERVVEDMSRLGVRTVQSLEEVVEPVVVFSAHGVPPSLHRLARERGLEVLDTTCRFVHDIHRASQRALAAGSHLVFIGNPDHREVIGYTQDLDPATYHVVASLADVEAVDWSRYEHITIFYQTTLNAEEYEDVVRAIERANAATRRAETICYATRENQEAARRLAAAAEIDLVLVIGGRHSANTKHLYDICARLKPSHLIQGAADIDPAWLGGVRGVGLTAGASTPDYVMAEVEARLVELGGRRA